jgi:oligopeptide transport system substrate-binding protein
MSKSKIITLLLVIALIGGIVAYGFISSCSTLEGSDKGARIPIHLASYPESLDPASQQYDEDTVQFFSLIYSGLTRMNSEGEVVGVLADNWYGKYNERDNVYRIYFELKESFWSDGSRVSADDFVFAWKRILGHDFESPYASMLYCIENAAAVKAGDMTSDDLGLSALDWNLLEITIDPECTTLTNGEKNGEFDPNLFAEIVASPAFYPLKEDVVTRNKDTWYNTATDIRTNGPFKVAVMQKDVQIVLERNAYFFRSPEKEDDIPLDKYVLPHKLICYYGDAEAETVYSMSDFMTQYDGGDLFYLSNFDKDATAAHGNATKTEVMSTYAFFFNTKSEALADAEVRNALSAALDRNEIANILGNGAAPATGIVPHSVFYTSAKDTFRGKIGEKISASADTSKISALSGRKGSFTISYLNSADDNSSKLIAEYAAGVWGEYGFDVTTKGVNETFYKRALSTAPENAEVSYDVIAVNLAMHCTDALSYVAQFSKVCSGGYISIEEGSLNYSLNSTGIEDETLDALVKEAIYCGSRERRAELSAQIEEKLLELCPVAPLYFSTNSYVTSGKLTEIKKYYGGMMGFHDAELEGYKDRNRSEEILSGIYEEEEAK